MKIDVSNVHPELQPLASKLPAITFSARTLWVFRLLERLTG